MQSLNERTVVRKFSQYYFSLNSDASIVRAVTKECPRSNISDPCLDTRSDLGEHVRITVEAVDSDDGISVNR